MSSCSGNCSTCGSDCADRKQESLLAALNPRASVKKVIAVVSGKGGVGKSTVTSMLAVAMSKKGKRVAVLDADIEAAAANYQELTRLLGEKEQEEELLMDLMEQWENAQT